MIRNFCHVQFSHKSNIKRDISTFVTCYNLPFKQELQIVIHTTRFLVKRCMRVPILNQVGGAISKKKNRHLYIKIGQSPRTDRTHGLLIHAVAFSDELKNGLMDCRCLRIDTLLLNANNKYVNVEPVVEKFNFNWQS